MEDVTILVSVYDKRITVEDCMRSLLEVCYPSKKILIIDNYSTDGSYELLKKYENQIELHRLQSKYAIALNWALERIETEYVALTDADCVVDKNWLTELIKEFDEEDVIATAGYCGTPTGLNLFQTLIGWELERRFKNFPLYISRAPTMNLCVKTKFAKKIKFDEKIPFGIETDFGYRLTKFGRMRYVPTAKVFHYHRSSLGSYFKQQAGYAQGSVRIYSKHKDKILGDHISTPVMMIQMPLFALAVFFLLLSLLNKLLIYVSFSLIFILFLVYLKETKEIIKTQTNYGGSKIVYLWYFPIFFLRTIAWFYGTLSGILLFIVQKFKKN